MIVLGDSREVISDMIARGVTVHSIVTDPPYGLTSVVKRFGKAGSAPAKSDGPTGVYKRASAGFMGQEWDGTGIEQDPSFWRLCYDVLPPGGHLLAFGGTRTWHRIACAIEDSRFEIRDCIMWLYGTGFPKSHNHPGGWHGWGTALKPAWEPVIVARKPLVGTAAQNVLAHGTGALNIDACRIPGEVPTTFPKRRTPNANYVLAAGFHRTSEETAEASPLGRWPANVIGDADLPQDFWRFFYTTKASKKDRNTDWQGAPIATVNSHPTVKPTDLMQWLVRLVTPPGGIVLDPFCGSGSTGVAARREGFRFVGIEADASFASIAAQRFGEPETLEAAVERLKIAVEANRKVSREQME